MYNFEFNIENGDYFIQKYEVKNGKNTKNPKEEKGNLYTKKYDKKYLITMNNLSGSRIRQAILSILTELSIFDAKTEFVMDLKII